MTLPLLQQSIVTFVVYPLLLGLVYLKVLPWLETDVNGKARWKTNRLLRNVWFFVRMSVVVALIFVAGAMFTSPEIFKQAGPLEFLFLLRVTDAIAAPHTFSYIPLIIIGLLGAIRWGELRGLLYAGIVVSLHEAAWFVWGIWILFGQAAGIGTWQVLLVLTLNFFFLGTLLTVWWKGGGRLNKIMAVGLVIYLAYLFVWWIVLGFPVTTELAVQGNSLGSWTVLSLTTPFYHTLWVNAVEVNSWWVLEFAWAYNVIHGFKWKAAYEAWAAPWKRDILKARRALHSREMNR